jgi:glycosyltransferase involved in cell wall biosynthesis
MDRFAPRSRDDVKVRLIRQALGVSDDQIMILTAGGDGASKGAQEVMQALALIDAEAPDWRYVCKVWPQQRTVKQNQIDLELAAHLGIGKKVTYSTNVVSHNNFMPYLLAACDIYAAPSRLEGFGMVQVEANACAKPVIAIGAMAFLDTMVHGETAFLANVAEERKISEGVFGEGHGIDSYRVVFPSPRTVEYRASVPDIARYLLTLMRDSGLRRRMGEAGRKRVAGLFDYRQVARSFLKIVSDRLGIH